MLYFPKQVQFCGLRSYLTTLACQVNKCRQKATWVLRFTLYHMRQQKDACTEAFMINLSNIMETLWLETVDNKICLGQYSAEAKTSTQTAAGYAHGHSAKA